MRFCTIAAANGALMQNGTVLVRNCSIAAGDEGIVHKCTPTHPTQPQLTFAGAPKAPGTVVDVRPAAPTA